METPDKTKPFPATLLHRERLTKEGSTKETFHVELCIKEANLDFAPGDSIGIFPLNPSRLVERTLKALSLSSDHELQDPRSGETFAAFPFFQKKVNLFRVTTPLIRALAPFCREELPPAETETLFTLLERSRPGNGAWQSILPFLSPLLPRFYSIASSPLLSPHRIDLTVGLLSFRQGGEEFRGIASEFLCYGAEKEETPIPLYVQKSRDFRVPEDKEANLIMIGPGTGVAPFRAFMQERHARGDAGKNWLFFGERHRAHDFLYEDFWHAHVSRGALLLDTAFSRDQGEKVYVQHRLKEKSKELWRWMEEGAYLYICGDAKQMAKEVLEALTEIAQSQGALTHEAARDKIRELKKQGRLLLDVY